MKFTKDHEWVDVRDGIARVGITDHAQHALGDVVSVELPDVGRLVKRHESVAVVDSMKASSDVYAPLSGQILEVNVALTEHPEWVNESPQERGWFFTLKPSDLVELNSLLSQEQYDDFLKA
ncbi:MAG TPA: glycine cleavage system protein GcvH [Candidatus Norongarragalinales archaeon]|nr:glycine cleavage system protein GcvH [Candidatus Norongarragalinales archaeon]